MREVASIDRAGATAWFRCWRIRLAVALAACCPCAGLQADAPRFSGRVVLELVEEIGHDHMLRVMEKFAFHDEHGREWLVPTGALLDGWSIPRALRALPSLPLESEFRKSAVVHGHFSHVKAGRWRDVHHMLYSASLAEGIPPTEAKTLYMTIYASGWRWEPKGSSCYGSCHAAAAMLAWRPDATAAELAPVAEWLERIDPTLEQIEERVDAALKRPGPHLFTQLRQ
jgi:hypothetical protein